MFLALYWLSCLLSVSAGDFLVSGAIFYQISNGFLTSVCQGLSCGVIRRRPKASAFGCGLRNPYKSSWQTRRFLVRRLGPLSLSFRDLPCIMQDPRNRDIIRILIMGICSCRNMQCKMQAQLQLQFLSTRFNNMLQEPDLWAPSIEPAGLVGWEKKGNVLHKKQPLLLPSGVSWDFKLSH